MNERIRELAGQAGFETEHHKWIFANDNVGEGECHELLEKFAELIVQEYVSEYNKLINGEAVVLPKDREHAEALVRVGMFYLENNK